MVIVGTVETVNGQNFRTTNLTTGTSVFCIVLSFLSPSVLIILLSHSEKGQVKQRPKGFSLTA